MNTGEISIPFTVTISAGAGARIPYVGEMTNSENELIPWDLRDMDAVRKPQVLLPA